MLAEIERGEAVRKYDCQGVQISRLTPILVTNSPAMIVPSCLSAIGHFILSGQVAHLRNYGF